MNKYNPYNPMRMAVEKTVTEIKPQYARTYISYGKNETDSLVLVHFGGEVVVVL